VYDCQTICHHSRYGGFSPTHQEGRRKENDKLVIHNLTTLDSKLQEMREKLPNSTYIFPRPNDLDTGLFHDDINGVLCEKTKNMIDGFCIPKVNNVEMVQEIGKLTAYYVLIFVFREFTD